MSENNAWKHGLHSAFALGQAGESALQPDRRSRLAELRAELAEPDGVIAALLERAARMVLIAEWGESWLREKAEREGQVAAFTSPMLTRFFTAAAEARRALEALAKVQAAGAGKGPDAGDVLEAVQNEQSK